MTHLAQIYADGMSWWAAMAGFLVLRNIFRGFRPGINESRDWWMRLLFALFLLIAGFFLPLVRKWDWLAVGTLQFEILRSVNWTLASSAGWIGLSGRAQRPWAMRVSGGLLLGGALFASALSNAG